VYHHLKRLALVYCGSWVYAGHFATYFKWLSFQLIYLNFGVLLITPNDHTHLVWHGRPPVPCTGSHTTWRDAISFWLLFQLTWTLWASGLFPVVFSVFENVYEYSRISYLRQIFWNPTHSNTFATAFFAMCKSHLTASFYFFLKDDQIA